MKIINLSEKPCLINQFVTELRDVTIQNDRMRFRRNLERIGEAMALEIGKGLTYSTKFVETPLGMATVNTPDDHVVVGTVFRAGLPLHTGFLNIFDRADNAFVSAYRYYRDKECRQVDVHIEYIATPCLDGTTLMLVDPMLATGGSADMAITKMKELGCKNIKLMILVAAPEGVEAIYKKHPDVQIYCAALDDHLNEHGYIVPGLGDAGDRIFGTK